ncbi:MAG: HAD family phosphatase [Gemmatimonadetes bacterium]|nr:MAG: HAD family phosphatase [Gemmatimonadota bacterium]
MMIHAVIFDMDGVLVDSEPIYQRQELDLFRELGIEMSEAEHNQFVGMGTKTMCEILIKRYHLNWTVPELVEKSERMYLEYFHREPTITPITGAETLIQTVYQLRLKIALASSSSRENIRIVLERLGFGDYFPIRVSGEEVPQSKPAPDIFRLAANRLQVEPAHCLVIEDSRNGVLAAKAAGMRCIGYAAPNARSQGLEPADIVVTHLTDIHLNTLISQF